ncbi:MAG: hypothetical protein SFV15_02335 [Polyangiaceae bacterium]|nr:hypothetical protein [Polyangiaceae bacterium]
MIIAACAWSQQQGQKGKQRVSCARSDAPSAAPAKLIQVCEGKHDQELALLVAAQGLARAGSSSTGGTGRETRGAATATALERWKTVDARSALNSALAIDASEGYGAVGIVNAGCATAGGELLRKLAKGQLTLFGAAPGGAGLTLQAIPIGLALIATLAVDCAQLAHRALTVECARFFLLQLAHRHWTIGGDATLPWIAILGVRAFNVAAPKCAHELAVAVAVDQAALRELRCGDRSGIGVARAATHL